MGRGKGIERRAEKEGGIWAEGYRRGIWVTEKRISKENGCIDGARKIWFPSSIPGALMFFGTYDKMACTTLNSVVPAFVSVNTQVVKRPHISHPSAVVECLMAPQPSLYCIIPY